MAKILVTGGAGYVGHRLVPALLQERHQVIVYDTLWFGNYLKEHKNLTVVEGDIRDTDKIKNAMRGCDMVIHMACISNDPSFELDESLSRTINLDCFEPLLKAAVEVGVRRFINCSTSSVYGVSDSPNVTEDHPHVPLTLYNRFKSECETILKGYASDNFICVTIRPSTVCGYSQRMRFDLAANILTNQAINTGKIIVLGGNQLRPNVHINDLVRAYKYLVNAPEALIKGEVFNCGAKNYSIMELAGIIKGMVESKFKKTVEIEVRESVDPRSYHVNSDKIRNVLSFRPLLTVQDAVSDLCEAFRLRYFQDSMNNEMYYNVKRMRSIFPELYKNAGESAFDPNKGVLSEIDLKRIETEKNNLVKLPKKKKLSDDKPDYSLSKTENSQEDWGDAQ